jgi:hypothetical protein
LLERGSQMIRVIVRLLNDVFQLQMFLYSVEWWG